MRFKMMVLAIILTIQELEGQTSNLIPNPSFEKVKIIDRNWSGNYWSFNDKMKEWTSPTMTSPDLLFDNYLDEMEPARPNVDFAECSPRTGRLMVGIKTYGCINRVYHCKEYIQVKLKEKIEPGKCYKYGFWASTINSSIRSNNLGIALSDTLVTQFKNRGLLQMDHKYREIEIVGDMTGEWYKIEGEISPKHTFQYFLVGNFSSDVKTQSQKPRNSLDYSYYMIDDVFLHEIDCVDEDAVISPSLVLSDVMFNFDTWDVNEQGKRQIDDFMQKLNSTEINDILIVGHTDEIGTETYNLELSAKRAQSVKEVFVESGVSAIKIRTIGLGSSKLVDEGTSAKNRRVEITVK